MSIIIKSDQASSSSIGNIFGINSKLDYTAMMDFTRQEYYIKDGGVKSEKSFEDLLRFTRASPAYYTDESGRDVLSGVNIPRFSSINNMQNFGLLMEGSIQNLLTNPFSPTTQTVSVPSNNSDAALVLSVKGSGSAVLSGSVLEDIRVGKATEGNPQVAIVPKSSGAQTVQITVTGELSHFQLEFKSGREGGVSPSSIVPEGVVKRESDSLQLQPPLLDLLAGAFTIVLGFELVNRIETTPPIVTPITILEIKSKPSDTLFANMIFFHAPTESISVSYIRTSIPESPALQYTRRAELALKKGSKYTMAISSDAGGLNVIHSANGVSGEVVKVSGTGEPTPQLINGSVLLLGNNLNGVLTHLAIFSRQMKGVEIERVTNSWV